MSDGNVEASSTADGSSPIVDKAVAILIAIRSSFLNFMIALGVVFIVFSLLLELLESHGVVAGMFTIYGFTLLGYGLIGRIGLRLIGYN